MHATLEPEEQQRSRNWGANYLSAISVGFKPIADCSLTLYPSFQVGDLLFY